MLSWAVIFFIIAIVAGILGFGGIAGAATGIAKILFFIFLIIFIISLVRGRRPGISCHVSFRSPTDLSPDSAQLPECGDGPEPGPPGPNIVPQAQPDFLHPASVMNGKVQQLDIPRPATHPHEGRFTQGPESLLQDDDPVDPEAAEGVRDGAGLE